MTLGVHSLLLLLSVLAAAADGLPNKLLVILLEGFRHDYPGSSPGFRHMALKGVHAKYLQPNFPTDLATNMYSIMTGLYPESHGMVGDVMLDIKNNVTFNIRSNSSRMWWDGGDPLWTAAVRQGKRAFLYDWPGCELFIRDLRPTYCKRAADHQTGAIDDFTAHVRDAVHALSTDMADFVGVHFSGVDAMAHRRGPHDAQVRDMVEKVADVIAHLQALLASTHSKKDGHVAMKDVVNVIVMSDHGITGISPEQVINVTALLPMTDVREFISTGTALYVWPVSGKEDKVYASLEGKHDSLAVFKKDQLPESWHLKKASHLAPLVAVANINWMILAPDQKVPGLQTNTHIELKEGAHGYLSNNSDMRAIFYASGPNFKPNVTLPAISNVQIYQIMCSILDIKASPHNGTWSSVSSVLIGLSRPAVAGESRQTGMPRAIVALIVVAAIFAVISLVCGLYCQRDQLKSMVRRHGHKWQPVDDAFL